jgi:hypothetical protein
VIKSLMDRFSPLLPFDKKGPLYFIIFHIN